ncbi:hypothetical protein [Vampirovibrio sp.]|uniref:hypothetical protein n=1 Tax=Vampirovibrio sp. TaxID=2717857 RepID=UPI003593E6DF
MENAVTQTLEDWIEGGLQFFFGFLRTYWRMVREPGITAQQLVWPAAGQAVDFTLPYTYFALSFLLNFLLLRTLFRVLHEGRNLVQGFVPMLMQNVSNPAHLDPLTAFMLMILKVIPLFGVVIVACGWFSKRLRLSESMRFKALAVFCYCFGFFWNNLTICLLALLAFAQLWLWYGPGPGAQPLLMTLYTLLGLLALLAVLICYRFIRQMFRALLTQEGVAPHRNPLALQWWGVWLLIVDIAVGLGVEYGMTLLDVSLFKG